jgi:hypothetical protein
VWECICDCGGVIDVHTSALTTGHTRSCGCIGYEKIWYGGKMYETYCKEWTKELKEFIKYRDGNRCSNPCCSKVSTRLTVHHIDYDKQNNKENNLISLCKSCHAKTNFNRLDWANYFKGAIK